MEGQMFCFQCEQTAGGTGCTGAAGVCGKKADTANLQDKLTGALISLAMKVDDNDHLMTRRTDKLMVAGLFSTITNVDFNNDAIEDLTDKVADELAQIAGFMPGRFAFRRGHYSYDMRILWEESDDIRSLKSLVLFGLRGMAAYAYHAGVLGYRDKKVYRFFYKALAVIGQRDNDIDELIELVLDVGKMNYRCMRLLDHANTDTFGHPEPTEVSLTVEKGPFIVVSGHDLLDLKLILDQTAGRGVDVYTHGEMLPAHGYPEFWHYRHFKGNFGTAWQNQREEFKGIPAPIVFTTNCLMPPLEGYADRVFTTGLVSYPGTTHIGEEKDFGPVIEKALELGGYSEDKVFTGINGGDYVSTGFGRQALLERLDDMVNAVEDGRIRHFFLVGGCDGAKAERNYFTELVKKVPEDAVIFTMGCGKYRFNDIELGSIDGIFRLMDMGQCNDAYTAIEVLPALADELDCTINDLPLSIVLSWYEQKAVSVLLTLLYLGVENIWLGPSLPAFISPGVLRFLKEEYGVRVVSTPEADLGEML